MPSEQTLDTADDRPQLHVGDHVHDREKDRDAPLVVVATLAARADEHECYDGTTVADYNEDYPADDRVVEAVFAQRTTVDIERVQRYAYPRSRLQLETPVHDDEEAEN
ncbi:hypothetical protein [Haloarcula sp. CBA1122]|uniref:hypothetical protein n=1 Tax=Haloarcula sp. CBA1122 TaxID=2668069 RepID=UPI00130D2C9A|nr:hypothetical protein [Haloarcula sp. CBA1122]MUV51353.1 hypothetical protein [Haloarcula sp. CBA1122]